MRAATEKTFILPNETKYRPAVHTAADHAMREQDRVTRWKKVHDLLRKNNKKARKEQDVTIKECAAFRKEKLVSKEKRGAMGLRWGVSIPPMTWQALVQADIIATGASDLAFPDKESTKSLKGSNQIVKDLERAFPQYRVS